MATALAPEATEATEAGPRPDRGQATDDVIAAMASLVRTTKAVARASQDRLGATGTPLAVLRALSRGRR